MFSLTDILEKFGINDGSAVLLTAGHINKTYMVQSGNERYILQSVNSSVFPEPEAVMRNISRIIPVFEKDALVKLPQFLTADGEYFVRCCGDIWRLYRYIESGSSTSLFQYGFAVGRFIRNASSADFIPETVIGGFHDYSRYLRKYISAGGNETVFERICTITERTFKELPKRMIHGDAKPDNVISGDIPTVIDLDTVMLHYAAIDYGDMIRNAADTKQIAEITSGFASGLDGLLTDGEIESLYCGALWVTSELAMRYYTDALSGEGYFGKSRTECKRRGDELLKKTEWLESNKEHIRSIINECFR